MKRILDWQYQSSHFAIGFRKEWNETYSFKFKEQYNDTVTQTQSATMLLRDNVDYIVTVTTFEMNDSWNISASYSIYYNGMAENMTQSLYL